MVCCKMTGFDIEFKHPNEYNALVPAYLGDTLYDLYVRSRLISEHGGMNVNKLHSSAIKFVRAKGQSDAAQFLEDKLTGEELAAYKRGRNTKTYTVPKNAEVGDYHRATGFESLLGWLYMQGRTERLRELMTLAYNYICELYM